MRAHRITHTLHLSLQRAGVLLGPHRLCRSSPPHGFSGLLAFDLASPRSHGLHPVDRRQCDDILLRPFFLAPPTALRSGRSAKETQVAPL